MKWLVAGVVVVVAGVGAWFVLRPADLPLEYGAPGFPPRGELIDDEGLVEDAARAWLDGSDPPEGTIRALWAGRAGKARKIVLLAGRRTTTVEVDDDGKTRTYGTETVAEGSPIVVARNGIVVAEGAPERWTETSSDGPAEVQATDGFVPYDNNEAFIALSPRGDGDLAVDVLGSGDAEPALAGKAVTDGFVVAGEPEIVRLEIRTGGRTVRRRGSFAHLPGVTEAEVAGFTRDGERVEALAGG